MLQFSCYFLFLVMFSMAVVSLSSNWMHILSALILLEIMGMSLFCILSFNQPMNTLDIFMNLAYLTVIVCEGVLGLSVMISSVTTYGNELMSSQNLLKW